MKDSRVYLFSLFFVMSVQCAFAGQEGNGGDAVVCRDNGQTILSARLLDYYEGETLRDQRMDFSDAEGISEDAYVKLLIKRIGRLTPMRARDYQQRYEQFYKEAKFLRGVELADVPDSAHVAVPRGCKVEQLAIRLSMVYPRDKKYFINADIWDALSIEDRAGLIVHEIIYEEASPRGGGNSTHSRYINALVASGEIKEFVLRDFYRLLRSGNMYLPLEYKGMHFRYNRPIEFSADGRVPLAAFTHNNKFIDADAEKYEVPVVEIPLRTPTGEIKIEFINWTNSVFEHSRIDVTTNDDYKVFFYENGNVKHFDHVRKSQIQIPAGRMVIQGPMSFHENGQVKEVKLTEKVTLKTKMGIQMPCSGNVTFDENGFLMLRQTHK